MEFGHSKRKWIFIIAFVLSLCMFAALTAMFVMTKSRMEYAQMEKVVLVNANKINNAITKLLYKTQVLEALVVHIGDNANAFERVAATIVDDPAIKNVLIAPDGIVSNVYPLLDNEAVIGLNFFEPGNGNKEALQARESGTLVLGGPFELVQGGQAMVGRLPVYTKDEAGQARFWGLVSVTLYYPQALAGAELDELQNQGFAYEIWRMCPDTHQRQIIAQSNYEYNHNARYIEKEISILNANWQFRISPVNNWYQYPETWILGMGSLLVSCLVAFFAIHNYDLKMMKKELEVLTYIDPLTGTMNRRGLLRALSALLCEPACKLTLCYMDLNKFKYINDHFGHGMGDRVLQEFSAAFAKRTTSAHLFARMGGDEFILIFKGTEDEAGVVDFFDTIKRDLNVAPIVANLNGVPVDFSYGKAMYPSQCKNIDDLLSCADMDMYKMKIQ